MALAGMMTERRAEQSSKASLLIDVMKSDILVDSRDRQLTNVRNAIDKIESGRVTEIKFRQDSKQLPSSVTELGIIMEVKELWSKANSEIDSNDSGSLMVVRDLQNSKALSPIDVRVEGNLNFIEDNLGQP